MNTKAESRKRPWIQFQKFPALRVAALLLLLPLATWAGGVVSNCTEVDLRAAMAGGGSVTFACDGTITLASTITNTLDTVLDASGRQVTINGGGSVRVFCNETNVAFAVVNLTVANGRSRGGSALLNLGGNVNLTGVTFRTNTAVVYVGLPANDALTPPASGGAILTRGGTVNASNCSFVGNRAQSGGYFPPPILQVSGGAIRNDGGQVALRSCVFLGNQAIGRVDFAGYGDPAFGGAIYNNGAATLDLCTLTGNTASGFDAQYPCCSGFVGMEGSGGAIFNQGTLTADRTTLSGNTATGGAGGAGADGVVFGPTMNGSPGGSGGAATGAAICNVGSLWVTRSTFASNSVTGGAGGNGGNGAQYMDTGGYGASGAYGGSGLGGALFNSGDASLVNCTVASNTGTGGAGGRGGNGAGYIWGGSGGAGGNGGSGFGGVSGTCNLTNCTIAYNRGTGGSGGAGGAGSHGNPVNGAPGSSAAAWGGTACGPLPNTLNASNSPADDGSILDPKLGPLADNGGPTLTMALLPGSPAIDAGDTATAPPTDQRGYPRPAGLAADIGAFEYGSTLPILTISQASPTAVDILVQGNAGAWCRLLVSSKLVDWEILGSRPIGPQGTVWFKDGCDPASVCRFYRLVMP